MTAVAFEEVMAALRSEWRLDFRIVERILAELAHGGGTLSELVCATAIDRRAVEVVLERLGPCVDSTGGRFTLAGAAPVAAHPGAVDPADRSRLMATMEELRRALPASLRDLDHVSATAATMVNRAVYFIERFALDSATVLLVGDHDLTSVALTLLEPRCTALVVDIDQRLLEFIAAVARARDLPITTAFADLRLGFPPAFEQRADLAFTDPPYSPEGITLFLRRALAGLKSSGHERVAFAYGFADSQLTRGFRTQSALNNLRLVNEAVLPKFNRFHGAEAIGTAADLYVCRPTRWTKQALERAERPATRIYTQGSASVESSAPTLDPELLQCVLDDFGDVSPVLVGDGWPGEPSVTSLAEFLAEGAADRRPGATAVLLHPVFDSTLGSALLAATRRPQARVVTTRTEVNATLGHGTALPRLLDRVVDVDIRHTATVISVIHLIRRPPRDVETSADTVLARLVARPHSKIANVWREGLIDLGRNRGMTLTKNAARLAIRDAVHDPGLTDLRLLDVSRSGLVALVSAVEHSICAILDAPTGSSS